ncbi:MAG TPA: peptidase C14 caspase catalytic subunit p20, partial [Deltaproteobacteria bacterium]|nr:peptidase C14 caspase catalytic subunit p20 [Deltaproteobacteria bacterium]
ALEEGVHLLEHHFYDRAMVEFNQALALSHEEALASIKELFEDPQFANDVEALRSLGSNLLAKNPDDLDLANQLGNAERRQGNWQSAKRFYLHCLRHNPNVQFPAYNLAATIARTDHVDGAAVSALQPFEQAPGFILPDLEPLLPPLEELQKQVLEKEEAAAAEA